MTSRYFTQPIPWAQAIAALLAGQPSSRGVLISDICDTLIDANRSWYDHYVTLARGHAYRVVTIKEFRALGPRRCFEQQGIVTDYLALKTELMHSVSFHAQMVPIKASAELARWGGPLALPHGYLSTRPAVLGKVTHQNLRQHGFADTPILLRSSRIEYGDTIAYKLRSLYTLRAVLDKHNLGDLTIVFVDDYPQLIDKVNAGPQNILGILFDERTSWRAIVREHLGLSVSG